MPDQTDNVDSSNSDNSNEIEEADDRKRVIRSIESFMAGFAMIGSLILLLWALPWLPVISKTLLTFVVAVTVGFYGMTSVPVAHVGVPTLFGKRIPDYLLDEGDFWIPKPIIDRIIVDKREHNMEVKLASIASVDSKDADDSGEPISMAEMDVDTEFQWHVADAHVFLDVALSTIEDGISGAVRSTIRELGSKHGPLQLMSMTHQITERLEEKLRDKAKRWGIIFDDVFVDKVIPNDDDLITAFQTLRKEEQQIQGEKKEMEFVREAIKRLAEETGLPERDAAMVVMGERGKSNVQDNRISTDLDSGEFAKILRTIFGGEN